MGEGSAGSLDKEEAMVRIRALEGKRAEAIGAVAAAVMVAGLAACGAQAQEVATARGPVADAERTEAMLPERARQTVTVRITDGSLEVNPTTVRPGPTTFVVTNNGSVPYDLDVDGPGPDGEIENLPPGQTANMEMTLRVGTYEIESDPEGPGPDRRVFLTVRE
jgi:hypothetical protein